MIAVGGFMQETNDFSSLPTTRETFEEWGVHRGDEIRPDAVTTPELEAFLREVPKWSAEPKEILPLAEMRAWSQGRLTADALAWGQGELLGPLRDAVAAGKPVRGVLLALHGAMVAVGEDDPEGATLEAVRAIVGPSVPIVATVDLHVNTTPRMITHADAIVYYHCYPHIDINACGFCITAYCHKRFETGQRAVRVMERILTRGAAPVSAYRKLNVHLPVERVSTQATAEQVASGVFASFPPAARAALARLEQEPWCLCAGLGTTQPWLDVPDLGATFVVTADASVPGAVDRASAEADRLARDLWAARDEFMPTGNSLMPPSDAVRTAFEHAARTGTLVAIGDGADATTSGAPGDSTWLLQELLKHRWPPSRPALVPVVSPECVAEAAGAGVGATITTTVGGKRDTRFAVPWTVTAVVEKLFKGVFEVGEGHCKGLRCDMGPCATLAVLDPGNDNADTGVRVVLASGSGAHFAAELFDLAGHHPFAGTEPASAVVCKSPAGFRATYGPHAGLLLSADARGCAPSQFWKPEYRKDFSKTTTPIFPLDCDAECHVDSRTMRSAAAASAGVEA